MIRNFHYLLLIVSSVTFLVSMKVQATDYDWQALNNEKVLVDSVRDVKGIPGVRAAFTVKASREKIWATLLDYENFPLVFEGIERMNVLSNESHGARIEFWVDAVLKNLHFILFRDYVESGHKLTWQRLSGDMKDIHGSWQILDTDDPNKKLLVYESYVDIGFTVATWLIRQGAKNKAKNMAHRLREWIENEKRLDF